MGHSEDHRGVAVGCLRGACAPPARALLAAPAAGASPAAGLMGCANSCPASGLSLGLPLTPDPMADCTPLRCSHAHALRVRHQAQDHSHILCWAASACPEPSAAADAPPPQSDSALRPSNPLPPCQCGLDRHPQRLGTRTRAAHTRCSTARTAASVGQGSSLARSVSSHA
eukprot:5156436-Prymnesium_polylepis.2